MSLISIIGRGLDPAEHLSLSAIRTLQSADKIVGIETEKSFWKSLQRDFGIKDIEDLTSLYSNEDIDMVNYNRFVNYVLDLSSTCLQLALLVPGHPRLGVTFVELLSRNCPTNTSIKIIEGISSFDVMSCLIGIDPLEQGTALIDANRLLLFKYTLEPALCYFIYHVCSVGNSRTNFLNPSENNRIDLLIDYLLKFYPRNKEVYLCRAPNGQNERAVIFKTTIIELNSSDIDYSTSLYLPAEKPSSLNWEFLSLLR